MDVNTLNIRKRDEIFKQNHSLLTRSANKLAYKCWWQSRTSKVWILNYD